MLLFPIAFLTKLLYTAIPVTALLIAVIRPKRWGGLLGAVVVSFVAGVAVSIALNLIYAGAMRGQVSVLQIALGTYVGSAMFLLLRLVDTFLHKSLHSLFRLTTDDARGFRQTRTFFAVMLRVVILFALGLPYVMASLMIYRPRILPLDNPQIQLVFNYERVEFRTTDEVRIVAWWIPAQPSQQPRRYASRVPRDNEWGSRSAIICHGLASNKSNQLILARDLIPGGFNCLVIDFRAHGESGGQLTTFGASEKRDVLAAVKWVRQTHPNESKKIVGVGASMGAAALISAAADDSPEGRAISAIASYACYDDLWQMTASTAKNYFAPPLDWLLLHVGVPIASAETGADLVHYSPAKDAANLWPRPILYIQSETDEIIDFQRGQSLLDATSQPKYHLWYPKGSHNDILNDESAAKVVEEFLRTATSQPVI